MNKDVVEKNRFDNSGGGDGQFVLLQGMNYGNIGRIIWEVNFGVKGNQLWGKPKASVSKKGQTPFQNTLHRNFRGKTDLIKVRCYLYHPHYCYDCHWNILFITNSFIYWV